MWSELYLARFHVDTDQHSVVLAAELDVRARLEVQGRTVKLLEGKATIQGEHRDVTVAHFRRTH